MTVPANALQTVPRSTSGLLDCIHFLRDLKSFHQRLAAQNEVIGSGLGYLKAINLLSPDGNELVLMNKEQQFSSAMGWDIMLEKTFPGSVMAMDAPHHRYQRRIMNYAFKKDVLVNYLDNLGPMIQSLIGPWAQHSSFLVFNRVKQLTLDLASTIFLGVELDAQTQKINRAFMHMVKASVTPIRAAVPFTPMWYGVKGRQQLVAFLNAQIQHKRAVESADFFSQFCHATSADGERFSDAEIVDHMAFLLMAAHDTTTSTLTTIFYLLAKHPAWQEEVREESMALDKTKLEYADLEQLTTIELVLQEALRLYPALPAMVRGAMVDVAFKGYLIPQGTTLGISPLYTHHMPEFWQAPNSFDPMRFSAPRSEHKQHSHLYVPFGGGAHKCLGQRFAEMQIKSIMHQVVRSYRWTVAENYTMPYQRVPIGQPKDGLPITLECLS